MRKDQKPKAHEKSYLDVGTPECLHIYRLYQIKEQELEKEKNITGEENRKWERSRGSRPVRAFSWVWCRRGKAEPSGAPALLGFAMSSSVVAHRRRSGGDSGGEWRSREPFEGLRGRGRPRATLVLNVGGWAGPLSLSHLHPIQDHGLGHQTRHTRRGPHRKGAGGDRERIDERLSPTDPVP